MKNTFAKRRKKTEPIYDIHTHIIPKVDDGAASLHEALEIIEDEAAQGVRGIMLTPHFGKSSFEAEEDFVLFQYRALKKAVRERFPNIELRLGSEVRVKDNLKVHLAKRSFAELNRKKTVLLEFSREDEESYVLEKTQELSNLGYGVIIAHAERIKSLYRRYKTIEELRNRGVFIQLNADSILGAEDRKREKFCKGLLKRKMADFVASDVHNMTTRRSQIGACRDFLEKKYGAEYAAKLLVENPRRFFEESVFGGGEGQ